MNKHTKRWALDYPDARGTARYLLSLPEAMLKDLTLHAELQGISAAEFVRRAITASMLAHADKKVYARMHGQPSA